MIHTENIGIRKVKGKNTFERIREFVPSHWKIHIRRTSKHKYIKVFHVKVFISPIQA